MTESRAGEERWWWPWGSKPLKNCKDGNLEKAVRKLFQVVGLWSTMKLRGTESKMSEADARITYVVYHCVHIVWRSETAKQKMNYAAVNSGLNRI